MSNKYTAKIFIDAIPGSAGIISTIAKRIGCSWHTAKKHIDRHPTVRTVYDDELEQVLDLAETTVIGAMKGGDVGTARWFLSTKGKRRGYTEKTEIEQSGEFNITIINKSNVNPETDV